MRTINIMDIACSIRNINCIALRWNSLSCALISVLYIAVLGYPSSAIKCQEPQIAIQIEEMGSGIEHRISLIEKYVNNDATIYDVQIDEFGRKMSTESIKLPSLVAELTDDIEFDRDTGMFELSGVEVHGLVNNFTTNRELRNFSGEVTAGPRRFKFVLNTSNVPFWEALVFLAFSASEAVPAPEPDLDSEVKDNIDRTVAEVRKQAKELDANDYKRYEIQLHRAENLEDIEGMAGPGVSDPYAEIYYDSNMILRTCDVPNDLSPAWTNSFVRFDYLIGSPVEIHIMDGDLLDDDIMAIYSFDALEEMTNEMVSFYGQNLHLSIQPSREIPSSSAGTCATDGSEGMLAFSSRSRELCKCIVLAFVPLPIAVIYDFVEYAIDEHGSLGAFLITTTRDGLVHAVSDWLDDEYKRLNSEAHTGESPEAKKKRARIKWLRIAAKSLPFVEAIVCVVSYLDTNETE